MRDDSELILGIDGGGSKCIAVLAAPGQGRIGTGVSGPANPLHGFDRALDSIRESAQLALADAGLKAAALRDAVAGVGLAGLNLPSVFRTMREWKSPFKRIHLAMDHEIACLGAHQGEDGAIIITGTGTCGYSRVNGQSVMLGAQGFPLGDKGSGAWTGLEATRAVFVANDGLGPATVLSDMIADRLNAEGLALVEAMTGWSPFDFAKLAPLVFSAAEQRDEVAVAILTEGGRYLSEMARALRRTNPPRMSIIGGLSNAMLPWLDPDVSTDMAPSIESPEMGAIYFAQLAETQSTPAECRPQLGL